MTIWETVKTDMIFVLTLITTSTAWRFATAKKTPAFQMVFDEDILDEYIYRLNDLVSK